MKRLGRVGILLPAVLLATSGCATKDWVRELLGTREAELDRRVEQRVGRVEGRLGEEVQRVEGMGFRVTRLETSVGEATGIATGARDIATGARDRAEAAFARAESADRRLTRLWSNRHNTRVVDSLDVHFAFDRADLGDGAQTALVGVVRELEANPGLTVELTGYTDPRGALEHNYLLSQRRVEAVRRFLVEKGVRLSRVHALGLGPLADRAIPDEKKRRVTVSLTIDQD